jgi:proline iminopeptidase
VKPVERTGQIAGASPDIRLFARWVGDTDPVIVTLHGGPGASQDYLRPQFDLLATGRTLLYYDQRGGGQSPAPSKAPLDSRAQVADLAAIVRAESRPVPATLLGFSWGASLALLFALEHPELVARLALIGPGPAWPGARRRYEAEFERRQAAADVTAARAELSRSGLREKDPDAFWRRAFELSVVGYFKDPARAKNLTPFRVSSRAQKAVQESLKDADLRPRLKEIKVPTLILHGRYDPVSLESSETLAQLMPDARLVVFEDSGHALYAEETERFVREMDAFLPRHAA